MSIRWRKTGELLCGVMSEPMEGDRYIDDAEQYELCVVRGLIYADAQHKDNGLWYWRDTE